MWPNLGLVVVVIGPGNGAAQIQVVVVVLVDSELWCHPRVMPGFGDFLGRCIENFVVQSFPHRLSFIPFLLRYK
jgi:hypothetical protein